MVPNFPWQFSSYRVRFGDYFIQPLPQETWRKTFNYSYMKWDEVNTVSNWSSEGYLVPMISTTKLIGFFVSSGQGRHLGETGHLGDAEEALQPLRSAGGRYEDNHRRWVRVIQYIQYQINQKDQKVLVWSNLVLISFAWHCNWCVRMIICQKEHMPSYQFDSLSEISELY